MSAVLVAAETLSRRQETAAKRSSIDISRDNICNRSMSGISGDNFIDGLFGPLLRWLGVRSKDFSVEVWVVDECFIAVDDLSTPLPWEASTNVGAWAAVSRETASSLGIALTNAYSVAGVVASVVARNRWPATNCVGGSGESNNGDDVLHYVGWFESESVCSLKCQK